MVFADTKVWYRNGLKHRIDGPAVIRENGEKEYWLDGVQYATENEYNFFVAMSADKVAPSEKKVYNRFTMIKEHEKIFGILLSYVTIGICIGFLIAFAYYISPALETCQKSRPVGDQCKLEINAVPVERQRK